MLSRAALTIEAAAHGIAMLDPASLLAPISDAAPCGEDLSFSVEFDTIQAARKSDDPSLDQGEWVTDLKVADWPFVVKQCSDLLGRRTKDIRLAVWLSEALSKTSGYAGFASGLELLAQMCERYWDAMHPLAEDGDQEQRVGNVASILARTEQLMREQPLTRSEHGNFTLLDQRRMDPVKFDSARIDTPREFYAGLLEGVRACKAALTHLQRVIDERLGHDGPSFSKARDAVDDVLHTVQRMAQDAGVADAGADTADTPAEAEGPASGAVTGEIKTRAQALEQLKHVADFFRRTEPHSPVAYLADTAVRWGNMPLHAWLRSVLKDGTALSHVEELLGVQNEAPKS